MGGSGGRSQQPVSLSPGRPQRRRRPWCHGHHRRHPAGGAGEDTTAPLLFTAFGNRFLAINPAQPMSALPLIVFHDALTPYPSLVEQAWGAALVLVALTLAVNLASRFVLRRRIALAGRL